MKKERRTTKQIKLEFQEVENGFVIHSTDTSFCRLGIFIANDIAELRKIAVKTLNESITNWGLEGK